MTSADQVIAPWEQFCKEEARSTAAMFIHHVDDYKRRDHGARGIPEAAFAKEFSAAFVDAVLALSPVEQEDHRLLSQARRSKTWWNFFRLGKTKDSGRAEDCNRSGRRTVVLESLANHLTVGETLLWKPCRLVIAMEHGNSQIEVYSPPKNSIPKMSLFCFLIEKVRTATLLEAPESNFALIIKCHQKGEYIFDLESKEMKDKWLKTIELYCSYKGAVLGALGKPSDEDGEACSLRCDINGLPRGTMARGDDLLQMRPHPSTSPSTRRRKAQSVLVECRPHSPIPIPPVRVGPAATSDPLLIVNGTSLFHRAGPPDIEHINSVRESLTPENCSNSSSTSALHPVSIAAAQRLATTTTSNHQRKSSAPSLLATSPSHNSGAGLSIPIVTVEVPRSCSNDALYSKTVSVPTNGLTASSDSGVSNSVQVPMTCRESIAPMGAVQSESIVQPPVAQANQREGSATTSDSSIPVYVETYETNVSDSSWVKNDRDVGNLRVLSQFPWFHGLISRTLASDLVLAGNDNRSGRYLVRQSESREGDFVLTFNYHNRAKHLRLTLNENGCNIQHLWFDNVANMLEHFKTNSIPLESYWLNEDVKLTTYIERSASDAFRTPTVVNPSRVQRVPPRRSHSLHINTSRRTTTAPSNSASQLEELHSSSLPQSARYSTDWRQLFHSNSSSGGITSQDSMQQVQSGSSSLLEPQRNNLGRDRIENNYVYRS